MSKPASTKQKNFIRSLVEGRKSRFPLGVDAFMTAIEVNRLTAEGASITINELLRYDEDPKAPAAGGGATDPGRRTNQYGGKCHLCGGYVEANEGYLAKPNGRWASEHKAGQCLTADAPAPAKGHKMSELVGDLPDGYYAVASVTGVNDLSFFRIGTNKGVINPERKGQRFVRLVSGGDGNEQALSYDWVTKAVALVRAAGIRECQALYGQEIGSCGMCGRTLTDEESRKRGIGPDCASRM